MNQRAGVAPATVGMWVGGALVGGAVGSVGAVLITELIKDLLVVVSRQDTWLIGVCVVVGVAVSVALLHGLGRTASAASESTSESTSGSTSRLDPWITFPAEGDRADLTAPVVAAAGREETFPWRLAPLRALAVISTVGLGAPMGTEAPAAHLGSAAGAAIGARGGRSRELARHGGLAGGAAAVAALMGIPLVGTAFMLELGRRRQAPITVERCVVAFIGGLVGWGLDWWWNLSLIRLVVPRIPPEDVLEAIVTAGLIGLLSGTVTALMGTAIYRARGWSAALPVKFGVGVLGLVATVIGVAAIATPSAAAGPGGATIVWAETANPTVVALVGVLLLRIAATTAAVAAGGCGGVFVPFLAIGDLAGRVVAPGLGVSGDLAGAAGAAGGIAGGYHLPVTALAMVMGIGGPFTARLTCFATVGVAAFAGAMVGRHVDARLKGVKASTAD
jgi:H+/Cl- antiporter ClcA